MKEEKWSNAQRSKNTQDCLAEKKKKASYVTFNPSSLIEMLAGGDERAETGGLRDAYKSSENRQL